MTQEETTVETQDETQEGQTAQAEETTEESQSEEPVTTPEQMTLEERVAKAEAEAAKYRRLFEKGQKPTDKKAPVSTQPIDIDERVLKAQGMSDEVLKQLKDVAKLRGLSLIDAQTDPVFQALKSQLEQEEKSKKAQLGASRGAPKVTPKKEPNTPGLTREEHMALAKERMR